MNKLTCSILFLIGFSCFSFGQVTNDAKLWTAIEVSKKVEDFTFSLSHETRFDENFSHIDKDFLELGAAYKISKRFAASANFRLGRDNDYESRSYDLKNRIDIGLAYKHKLKKFKFSYRIKYQKAFANSTENNTDVLRNKFSLAYKIKKFKPFAAYEFFYQFNDQQIINRTRLSIGTKYSINKKNTIKLFYTSENKFNTSNLKHNYIWGIGYALKL